MWIRGRFVAELPVLSKAYYTKHNFEETSLDPPLGSGPYEISDFKPGPYVTFKRRPDYWAKDLPLALIPISEPTRPY